MNNKTKGVIAGIAGLALLGGGTTFALWEDSATLTGATITNGNLEVSATPIAWVDASADRTDSPHPIDLTTWRMVPGDTARGTSTVTITLDGDNLVADLDVDTDVTLPTGVTATYDVHDGTTTVANDVPLGDLTSVRLSSSGTYTVTIDVAFEDVDEQVSAGLDSVLEDMTISLEQARDGAGFAP